MRRPTPLPTPPAAAPVPPAKSAGRGRGSASERDTQAMDAAASVATAPASPPQAGGPRIPRAGSSVSRAEPSASASSSTASSSTASSSNVFPATVPAPPIVLPTALSEGISPSEAASSDAAAATEPVERPARISDVWRAARARRRALRSEVRRFTVRARRRRLTWLIAGASVLALVITTVAVAYSPLFAVERIVVEGAVRLDPAALETALGDQLGRPLPRVDESEIKAALVKFPMVESYQVEARPPHELFVRIVERTPIGVIEGPAGYSLVDAAGVVLDTTPGPPAGIPVLNIAGGTDSPAFESAGLVMRALPDSIRAQVTGVTATTRDDVTLTLGGSNATVVWGGVEGSAQKALVLETAMQRVPPSAVVSYDVSSPDAIVIR